MIVQLALFTQLAGSCAPHVAVETLASVARTESGFDALAVHDNTSGRTFKPSSREEAIALTTELVIVQRHSVDLGLMQINSLNLPSLGLTVTDAFDPCRNLAAAERILVQGYTAPPAGGDEQVALKQNAFSLQHGRSRARSGEWICRSYPGVGRGDRPSDPGAG